MNYKNLFSHLALVFSTLLLTGTNSAFASNDNFQSLILIEDEIEYFLDQQKYDSSYPISFKLKNINRSLKLKKCKRPISVQFSGQKKNTSNPMVKVFCSEPKWALTLPIHIYIYKDVLVINRATPKNTLLQKSEVSLKKQDVSLLKKGFFINYNQIKQLQLKRPLAANTVLTPSHFIKKLMVKIGQNVTILNSSQFLKVKMTGKSLNNGGFGDIVRVKNLSSGKVIQATVIKNGIVKTFQ